MATSLKLLPGSTVRCHDRRYLIVDYESLDAIIARQPGKRRLERIPVNEVAPDRASHIVSASTPNLVSVPEEAWQTAVKSLGMALALVASSPNATVRHDEVSMWSRWRYVSRSVATGRRFRHTEAIEM